MDGHAYKHKVEARYDFCLQHGVYLVAVILSWAALGLEVDVCHVVDVVLRVFLFSCGPGALMIFFAPTQIFAAVYNFFFLIDVSEVDYDENYALFCQC